MRSSRVLFLVPFLVFGLMALMTATSAIAVETTAGDLPAISVHQTLPSVEISTAACEEVAWSAEIRDAAFTAGLHSNLIAKVSASGAANTAISDATGVTYAFALTAVPMTDAEKLCYFVGPIESSARMQGAYWAKSSSLLAMPKVAGFVSLIGNHHCAAVFYGRC